MEKELLQVYTINELSKKYKVSTRTFYSWIMPIRQELLGMYPTPKKRLRLLLPKQVKRISDFLG